MGTKSQPENKKQAEKKPDPPVENIENDKPHECPMCDYRAKTPSLLSRHINHHHAEVKSQTPKHLLKALNGKASIGEMLASVGQYIENATNFDEKLPEDVISFLKREDAKTQLILRVIAISKVQRALELGDRLKELDTKFQEKLNDPQFHKDATPNTYLTLVERMLTLQERELKFLNEIVKLGEINLNDLVDKLVTSFGTSRLGTKKSGGGFNAFQLTGVTMPDDPAERENLRKIIGGLTDGADEPSGGDQPLEAEFEEGSGSDPSED